MLGRVIDNLYVPNDPAENIMPDKEKIDGAVAMIMALDRAIRNGNEMIVCITKEEFFCYDYF